MTFRSIPASIDQYHLLRPLGRGRSGIVFAADDTAVGRPVAIKLIPRRRNIGTDLALLNEARVAQEVRHRHVVPLYATGAYAGGVYLVMEWMPGGSVQGQLADGPLPWPEATAVAIAACEGLAAVHARGILHRDVKPANLLRAADGTVKVADFGIARQLQRLKESSSWDEVIGTPGFMSPEQCRGEECDERTDIYALGATYHTLLTGRPPYADALPLRVLFEHCSAPVPDPCQDRPDIPRACAAIVFCAMARARAQRYGSVLDMQQALRSVIFGRLTRCRIDGSRARPWPPSRRTGRPSAIR
jgi:serine/threonine protein kinase